jgi:hypothetical protein
LDAVDLEHHHTGVMRNNVSKELIEDQIEIIKILMRPEIMEEEMTIDKIEMIGIEVDQAIDHKGHR